MTVQELIEELSCINPDATVRLAQQPSWPFEYSIGDIVEAADQDGLPTVFIGEGSQLDYLSSEACKELGW